MQMKPNVMQYTPAGNNNNNHNNNYDDNDDNDDDNNITMKIIMTMII